MVGVDPRDMSEEDCFLQSGKENHQDRAWALSIMAQAYQSATIADPSQMVHHLLTLMIQVLQADCAYFFCYQAGSDEFVITQVQGDPDGQHLVGLRLNQQHGIPGLSLTNTEISIVDDLKAEPVWQQVILALNMTQRKNVMHLPVLSQGRVLGVVQFFGFRQKALDLLTLLGSHLGMELERRNELDLMQQSNQRLLTLVDMLGEVAGTLDRNKLLHLVTENAARLVGAERSSLFLVDPNTSQMVYQVAYQPQENPASPPASEMKTGSHPIETLAARKKINPGGRPSRMPPGEFSFFNRSAITVPLHSEPGAGQESDNHDRVLGGLMVLNNPHTAFKEEDAQLIRILANQASTFLQVAEVYETTEELFLGVIKSLVAAIDAKDSYTQGHSQRVSDYSVMIAAELDFDETLVNDIRIGSLLHDIGKIGVPDSILLKKGRLTWDEMEFMKIHPSTGASILSQVKLLDPIRPCILEHHERLDGSGYPARLIDRQISWMGRIVAVADVYDAMTSVRPYRQPGSKEEVLGYLKDHVGDLFDSTCVRALENAVMQS